MQEEEIIRDEAIQFYDRKLNNTMNVQPIDDFHNLQSRLYDFNTPLNKAIFLDQISQSIDEDLKEHRNSHHNGVASKTCTYEKKAEKLRFYIKQEMDSYPTIVHQRFAANPKHKRTKVFVSYSHLDREYLDDVKRHFKPFLNQVDFWDDSQIKPGQHWKTEIKKAIDETKVAILLVSTDFLGSEFVTTDEIPPLLKAAEEDGAVILIVIVKPCLFEAFPKLNVYQAMNNPSTPVSKMDYNEKEELLINLVRETKRILGSENVLMIELDNIKI